MGTDYHPANVRSQLERVAGSKAFSSSARSAKLLRFIVEETLNGNAEGLKEYKLGAKGLERGDAFDPRIDPIVRAEASRLRTRLALYYGDEGKTDELVISLPKGSYVPVFEDRSTIASAMAPVVVVSKIPWKLAVVGLAAVALAAGSLAWRVTRPIHRTLTRLEIELRSSGSLGSTVGPDVAISPDGSRIAFVAQDENAVAHLYTLRLDEEKPVEFPGTDGAREQFFSPDGQWIAFHAEGKLRKVPAAGGPPVVLCDAGDLLGGGWADDGNIYAVLDSRGKLWRIPSNGGQPVAVTDVSPGLPAWPQVLPGSNLPLFTNERNGADAAVIEALSLKDGSRKVVTQGGTYGRYLPNGYLTYVNGGTLFAVAFDPAQLETRGTPVAILNDVSYSSTFGYAHAAVSQNGTLVYRRSTNLVEIEWLYPSGKTEPLLAKPARYVRPSLSPDGRRLAYSTSEVSGLNSWIYDISEKKTTRLDTAEGAFLPVWTPDGKFLVLGGRLGANWLRADGTMRSARLMNSPTMQMPASFTPDGKRLVYLEFSPATGPDLWTVPIESANRELRAGKPEPFQITPASESQAAFSTDGRWIAYNSTVSGSWEIYVQSFPPVGAPAQVSVGGGRIPFWSRNGHDLFYATERQKIIRVPYTIRSGVFTPSTPVVWTERRFADTGVIAGLDLAPDGERFAVLMPAEPPGQQQSPNHVTLLQNFFDEVERRVTAQK